MLLALRDIRKSYWQGGRELPILQGVDLDIHAGEMIAMVGPSGCGKTTLLQIMGLLDRCDEGEIWLEGKEISRQSDAHHTRIRNQMLGFVYQFHHLLPECSALENVMLPQMISGVEERAAHAKAFDLLMQLGLEDRAHHRPNALSGGQMQRVAIARALANNPPLILADEPTGNLDPETAQKVMQLLLETVRRHGTAMIMVTHNIELAATMDRHFTLEHGQLVEFA